jgi:hypothetical protein
MIKDSNNVISRPAITDHSSEPDRPAIQIMINAATGLMLTAAMITITACRMGCR